MKPVELLLGLLEPRLGPDARAWLERARQELRGDVGGVRFLPLFSAASRHAPRTALAPEASEREQALGLVAGWDPERWTVLETLRAALLLSRDDLATPQGAAVVEEAFRYADVGELCALYKCLALLPAPERFAWRAGEGARSNMRVAFESACCDTPYPSRHFDDLAWRQAVIKSLFTGAPTWRIVGLDQRLSPELARMALDFADERRSAGRPVPPQLWACLGSHGGERGRRSLERELEQGDAAGRSGAVLGLARAGARAPLEALRAKEREPRVRAALEAALAGRHDQRAFAAVEA